MRLLRVYYKFSNNMTSQKKYNNCKIPSPDKNFFVSRKKAGVSFTARTPPGLPSQYLRTSRLHDLQTTIKNLYSAKSLTGLTNFFYELTEFFYIGLLSSSSLLSFTSRLITSFTFSRVVGINLSN